MMTRTRPRERLCPHGYAFDTRRGECRYVGDVRALVRRPALRGLGATGRPAWCGQWPPPVRAIGNPDAMAWVARMQQEQILGMGGDTYTYGRISHPLPYSGLGADLPAYDLNLPGAVAEVKRALRALAEAESDPFKKGGGGVATEQTWKELAEDDIWDAAAAEEMILAISRYRGMGWQVPGPYLQQGEPGGGPQPSVNGLELIAGAANQQLGGAVKMKLYEAWRKKGCALEAACFDPPSAISRPASETVVDRTLVTGPRVVAPDSAPAPFLAAVKAADDYQQATWMQATEAPDETERLKYSLMMKAAKTQRDAAVASAVAAAPERTGTTTVDEDLRACQNAGGSFDLPTRTCTKPKPVPKKAADQTALYVGVGLGAVLLFWMLGKQKKGAR